MSDYKVKMVIVMRKDLNMRKGKMCSSAAHAAMGFLQTNDDSDSTKEMHVKLNLIEQEWFASGTAKIVVSCDSKGELDELIFKAKLAGIETYKVTDAGHTEFHDVPTVTCAAFGPANSDEIDAITKHLKLL